MNDKLNEKFEQALVYATKLHQKQTRKGTEKIPYIAHLLGVTAIVLENGGGEVEAIAALLHDAVEDQGGMATLEDIRNKFGEQVANIVEGCSDSFTTPKPPWKERKERYLSHLPHVSKEIRLVSIADKIYNVKSIIDTYRKIGEETWKRFNGGREGTLWYYQSVTNIYFSMEQDFLANELKRIVHELVVISSTH